MNKLKFISKRFVLEFKTIGYELFDIKVFFGSGRIIVN